jgi:ADP-dependent NAD(P)H-hydrate dehydratase / NAD(P)H-hydrate epimerase
VRPLLTPAQMSRADAATIAAGTPGAVLMERAGRAVARAVIGVAGRRYGRRAVIVCGKGNNGGDGFVAARILTLEGLGVRCLFVGDPSEVRGDAAHHLEAMRSAGVRVDRFDAARLRGADVIVDALFGTGFRGEARDDAALAIEAMNAASASVVAIDIPSGVNGETARVDGPAVSASVTVAMAAEKVGTSVTPGALYAGRVEVADIGIVVETAGLAMVEAGDVRAALPRREPASHKRSNGSVVLLGGSAGMSGAMILAATAAVRAGAGYVTVGLTSAIDPIVSSSLPEVLTRTVTDEPVLGPDALKEVSDAFERADAVAIGPGLGTGPDQLALVEAVLAEIEVPVVVDADGLNVLAGRTDALVARSNPIVITPHPGELARLLGVSTSEVQADRIGHARRAADDFGCTVVLKGFRSVIGGRDGKAVVNPTGGPELATAGTGDVLTGLTSALLAQGLEEFEAAWTAAFVHGDAGAAAMDRLGAIGVLASDIAEALPGVLRRSAGPVREHH